MYGELVMFSHTLFSIPFGIIGMLIAANGFPPVRTTAWILVALVSARTAANAMNRLVDRNIDAKNPRTADRHMPRGLAKTYEVVLLILACLLLLTISAFALGPVCVVLLPIPLVMFFIYSYSKRFTWACHIILGAACGCAPLGAWIATTGRIFDPIPFLLWLAVTLWVAGFDIIYGAQDAAFDRDHDLHSIPADFGIKKGLVLSAVFHSVAAALLVLIGVLAGLGVPYYIGTAIVTALFACEHMLVSPADLKRVTIASYGVNQIVSTVILISAGIDILIK